MIVGWASRPSKKDGRDAHPTNLWKLFNSHSLVKGFTKGIEEDYRKLGHFGKGGGEGYVWFYQGKGKLLVCENDAMGLG